MLIIDVLLKQIREKVLPAIVYTEKRALPRLIKEFLKHVLLQGGSITLIILVEECVISYLMLSVFQTATDTTQLLSQNLPL